MCPICERPDASLKAYEFDDGTDGHIQNGIVRCIECNATYPIEDDLLELVSPALLDLEDSRRFSNRFQRQLSERGLSLVPSSSKGETNIAPQLKQREHFDWYADNHDQSYFDYAKSPFWVAVDQLTFQRWNAMLEPDRWLLDVGCANGRASFQLINSRKTTVIGFDISKKLVRQAIERSRSEGTHAFTTFLVGDGHNLPFVKESFDYAMTYGVLHHLPAPGRSTRRIVEILKPGGVFLGSENNQTILRGLFDLMMKFKPLWTEEAGTEPLISRRMLRDWTLDLPVDLTVRSIVYLPPHLFNVLGNRFARSLMALTDTVAGALPFVRYSGGLIVFEIRKKDFVTIQSSPQTIKGSTTGCSATRES
jgi:SAM-dependent methyltransferase/uncharacterized protein YbaR (Trm112 family)